VADRLTIEQAPETAGLLLQAMQQTPEPTTRGLLAGGLKKVCNGLPPDRAASYLAPAAKLLAAALAKEADPSARAALASVLAEVCKALPPDRAAELLTGALVKEDDSSARAALARGLAQVSKALPPDQAIMHLLPTVAQDPGSQTQLMAALWEAAGRSTLAKVVESLRHPFCYGEARQVFLRREEELAGQSFRTRWELIAWLSGNHPEIDASIPLQLSP
jgi:hypothetical protein